MIERRPKRILPVDHGPPADPHERPAGRWPSRCGSSRTRRRPRRGRRRRPEARYEQRESVELAFIAALQHLPARQRAVLLLRDVLGFAPGEIAEALDATPASVYSALQRAHRRWTSGCPRAASRRRCARSATGGCASRRALHRGVGGGDVDALVALLAEDATFAMPPGRAGTAAARRSARSSPRRRCAGRRWRLVPTRANGQPAFGVYARDGRRSARTRSSVLTLDADGRIAGVTAFHDAAAVSPLRPAGRVAP